MPYMLNINVKNGMYRWDRFKIIIILGIVSSVIRLCNWYKDVNIHYILYIYIYIQVYTIYLGVRLPGRSALLDDQPMTLPIFISQFKHLGPLLSPWFFSFSTTSIGISIPTFWSTHYYTTEGNYINPILLNFHFSTVLRKITCLV